MFQYEREKITEIPFHTGKFLRVEIGFLTDERGTKQFRVSRSLDLVRARFRVTLQYTEDPEHTPYVFDIIPNSLDFRPDTEPAQNVWQNDKKRKVELSNALEFIAKSIVVVSESK